MMLGQLIDANAKRDAIHVAILPAQAASLLWPGARIGIDTNGKASPYVPVKIGIVDPFLNEEIQQDQWFYICLFPETVTSLRHVWTHPLIKEES